MRAHTGCALDAFEKAGFQVYDHSEMQSLCDGSTRRDHCDVPGAVVERMKEFYASALVYSPGTPQRELLAKLEMKLKFEAQYRM